MMKNTITGFSLAALWNGSLLRAGPGSQETMPPLALSCTVLLAVSLLQEKHVNIRDTLAAKPLAARWCVYLMLLFSIPLLGQITMTGGEVLYMPNSNPEAGRFHKMAPKVAEGLPVPGPVHMHHVSSQLWFYTPLSSVRINLHNLRNGDTTTQSSSAPPMGGMAWPAFVDAASGS